MQHTHCVVLYCNVMYVMRVFWRRFVKLCYNKNTTEEKRTRLLNYFYFILFFGMYSVVDEREKGKLSKI
jgi:hypothetical protein